MIIQTRIDGVTVTKDLPAGRSLMEVIGDGQETPCQDGSCLRCLVLLGDRVVPACKTPAFRAQSVDITTPNGLDQRKEYRDIIKAFRKVGLETCIETEPYLILLAFHLLMERESPTEEDFHRLSRHLNDRCSNREDFERALRIAVGLRRRRHHE